MSSPSPYSSPPRPNHSPKPKTDNRRGNAVPVRVCAKLYALKGSEGVPGVSPGIPIQFKYRHYSQSPKP